MKNVSKKYLGCLVGIIFVFCLAFVLSNLRPEGKYRFDQMASDGISFFELKNGKIQILTASDKGVTHYDIDYFGVYTNRNKEWICFNRDGDLLKMRITLFSLKILSTNNVVIFDLPRMFFK